MPCHPISGIYILILSSFLRLGLPSGIFHSGLPTKVLYTPRLSPIRSTCPANLFLVYLITRITCYEEWRSLSSSLCSLLHLPVTLSSLGPNFFLGTVLSNILSLYSSLNVILPIHITLCCVCLAVSFIDVLSSPRMGLTCSLLWIT
jgi:hypothetical protein